MMATVTAGASPRAMKSRASESAARVVGDCAETIAGTAIDSRSRNRIIDGGPGLGLAGRYERHRASSLRAAISTPIESKKRKFRGAVQGVAATGQLTAGAAAQRGRRPRVARATSKIGRAHV